MSRQHESSFASLPEAGSMPEVSVVMSVYNDARYLRGSLDSILSQEGIDFEFIIVDDGSTDDSPKILADYAARDSRIRVILQENAGLTRALITGCQVACGEFIARQDADDISLPGRLSRQVECLRSDPRLVFVSSQTEVIAPGGEVVIRHTRPTTPEEGTDLLLRSVSGPPGHGSVMFRRDTYQKVGGYRKEFYFAQDCDLWYRLAEQGMLSYRPEFLYQYRIAPGSVSGSRNSIKQAFATAVDECRALRLRNENEEPILEKCRTLRDRRAESSKASEAGTLYFLGRNLLRTEPASACQYLWQSIQKQPSHLRAWICLLVSPVFFALKPTRRP